MSSCGIKPNAVLEVNELGKSGEAVYATKPVARRLVQRVEVGTHRSSGLAPMNLSDEQGVHVFSQGLAHDAKVLKVGPQHDHRFLTADQLQAKVDMVLRKRARNEVEGENEEGEEGQEEEEPVIDEPEESEVEDEGPAAFQAPVTHATLELQSNRGRGRGRLAGNASRRSPPGPTSLKRSATSEIDSPKRMRVKTSGAAASQAFAAEFNDDRAHDLHRQPAGLSDQRLQSSPDAAAERKSDRASQAETSVTAQDSGLQSYDWKQVAYGGIPATGVNIVMALLASVEHRLQKAQR